MILGLYGNIKIPPESAAPFIKAWLTLNTVFSRVISGTNEQSILWDLLTISPHMRAGREGIWSFKSFVSCKLLTILGWAKIKCKKLVFICLFSYLVGSQVTLQNIQGHVTLIKCVC